MKHSLRTIYALLAAFLFALVGCQNQEAVLENLSEQSANHVLYSLANHGISAHKVPIRDRQGVSFQVVVAKKSLHEALKVLIDNDLPTEPSLGLKEVFPPGHGGVIPTKSEEIAKLTLAQKGEVENMLKSLPLVMNAKVVVNLENPGVFREPAKKSASIALIVREPIVEEALFKSEIKELVKTALGPIEYEDINVLIKQHSSPWVPAENPSTPQTLGDNLLLICLLIVTMLSLAAAAFGLWRVYRLRKMIATISRSAT